MKKLSRKSKITGIIHPRCPTKCKALLDLTNDPFSKQFKCTQCGGYFEKREVLSGWMVDNTLKEEFVQKIWELIIAEVFKNYNLYEKELIVRIEEAKKCIWYCKDCKEDFRCIKSDRTFEADEDGMWTCYLSGQTSVDCYKSA